MEITATTLKESVPEIEQDLVVPKDDERDEITGHFIVSTRKAATRARQRLSDWCQILGAPPEDVEETG